MEITYSIWQGSLFISAGNKAKSVKSMELLISELNSSESAKRIKFSATVRDVKVVE